jgi:uroporphyrinogen decarboxylase
MTAIARQLPDRIPADYKAEPEVNQAIMERLGLNTYDELMNRLEVDVRRIAARYVGPPSKVMEDGAVEDYWGIRAQQVTASHGTYSMYVETAIWGAESVEDLEKHSWPTCDIFDYSVMKEQCERYPEHAIMFEGSDLFTRPCILRGMENLMLDMALRPEMAHYIMEKFTSFYCEDLTRAIEATNVGFQLYCEWSDFGTQEGLLMSAPMWREFIKPYLSRLIDVCHFCGIKFMLHSCGAIRELIPDFIEIGVDILDPIQVMAKGMEPAGLKRDFGDQISFHGGVCTQSTLPFGTPDDVTQAVKECIDALGIGGGYIIAPSHNIQPDTSVDNILAMYNPALREYRG